ncbi:major facilitator superfamily transporter [Whalleya microplaca]|nr:major facilitator superfamily transporter [Whalleya microplaca]
MSEMQRGNKESHPSPDETPTQTNSPTEKEFKEGGFGWVVVFAVFLLNAHTWGLNSSYSVFLAYYLQTGAFGASPLEYAFVGGLSISIALLASPLATALAGSKRCGTQGTIFLGAVFETIGFVGSSFATELWQLLLSQGVSFGLGMGLCFVASASVPPQWFTKRRSLSSAIAASGSGFGGLAYSLASNAMISRLGLPWAFRILAIICIVVNGTASFFIRDRNDAIGSVHVAFNWKLFKRPSFLLFQGWLVLSLIGYVILVFSIVAYCQAVGLTASEASLAGALFNLAQGLGRITIGLLSDKVGRLNIASFSTMYCGLLCLFVWIFGARNIAGCIVFALLSGSVAGSMWATVAPICAEVVGLALIPSALSMSWLVLVLPATFAEVIGLSLREPGTWGYLHVQLLAGFLYIGASIFCWFLRAWKVWELRVAHLTKERRELAIRDNGVVPPLELERQPSHASTVRKGLSILKGFWAVERV